MKRKDPCGLVASATGPHQWITLKESGHVLIHTADLGHANKKDGNRYRKLSWRPTKADRQAIRRLIWKLNLVAMGDLGKECSHCDCYEFEKGAVGNE